VNGGKARERQLVTLGHIAGAQGLQGWVKIHSLTEPREAIFEYQPWLLGASHREVRVQQGKQHGNRLIALLEDTESREQAQALVNQPIAVFRDQFPDLPEGEFYWNDLLGLKVRLEDGRELGKIANMLATGANDVMVVQGERERLIPFIFGQYVVQVDLDAGVVIVDWDPEF
jgi:16S rRNA processing protein RimM